VKARRTRIEWRKYIAFGITFVVTFSIIFQSNMNGSLIAYDERTIKGSLDDRQQNLSSERESYFSDDKTGTNNIKTVKIVDYAQEVTEPESKAGVGSVLPFLIPFGTGRDKTWTIQAMDQCGDGSNQYTLQSGGVRWKKFPVTYHIDPSGIVSSDLPPGTILYAVKKAFQRYNDQVPYTLFAQTTAPTAAKIKVR
jgi:hypothetical protein